MPYKTFNVEGVGAVTIYKRRGSRSLRITLDHDGHVRVSIPWWTPYQTGLTFAASKRDWIHANAPASLQSLRSGMAVGKTRRLTFVADTATAITKTSVRGNEVVVWHNPQLTVDDAVVQHAAELACFRALKAEALRDLTPRLNELARRHGFTYRSMNIKRMKSRWGSCDQRTNIVLNLYLVQLPWEYIDYVIIHELTHTQVLHHGPDFWVAMERVLPDARQLKRRMRAFRPSLLANETNVA